MPKRKPTFADYGRLGGLKGGKSTSEAKVAAARKNGQKGGWPKGKARKIGKRKYRQVDVDVALGPTGVRLQPAKGTPRKGKKGKPTKARRDEA